MPTPTSDLDKLNKMERINPRLDWELNKQFPKGDPARGRAMLLFARAQNELNYLQLQIEDLKEKLKKYQ